MEPENRDLSPKQKLFCEKYCELLNATEAAKLAGYSEKTAYSIGCQNLKKVEIQKYIEAIQADVMAAASVSRLRVAKALVDLAFDEKNSPGTRLKGLEALRSLFGLDEPTKKEISGKDGKDFIPPRVLSPDEIRPYLQQLENEY